MIYFDNAATSWPKPAGVTEAMVNFMQNIGANPGRSGHRLSVEAGRIINDARELVAELFNVEDPLRVILGSNATDGLNLGIRGILSPGDHVITSSMEHNSVMRPLRDLETRGVNVSVVTCGRDGQLDPDELTREIRETTRLIVVNHASNIVGTLLSVSEIGKIAHDHEIPFMIDAAQTGGCFPIDMKRDNIDLIGFTGHKSLLGPQGTGGLVIGDSMDTGTIRPLKAGGTGSKSEYETQPDFLPDKFESGTLNTVGLAGLLAALEFLSETGITAIHQREQILTRRMLDGLGGIPGVTVYGPMDPKLQTPTISFTLEGLSPSEVGFLLDEDFDIMCRVGLHCAPTAHKTIGTFPTGTVRFGMGYFTTEDEIDQGVEAVRTLAEKAQSSSSSTFNSPSSSNSPSGGPE